ncbi:MAG: MFS transporter [Mobilitalea sp.]
MKGTKALKLSILSISFLMMLRLTISPALAVIGEAVNKDATEMQIMVIVASVVAIPFGFISGILAGKIKTKTILYISLVLYLIGGMGPMLMPNFTFMIVCRAILGAGTGLFLPFAAGLIADFYKGEEFNTMIGLQSAAVAVGNIITSALAGVLASINWRLSFLIYGFAIITFFLVALNIPEPVKVEKKKEDGNAVNGRMMFICLSIFVYAIIYFAFFGFISYVVEAVGGNAAQSGLATMVMTAMSLIMGLLFAKVLHLFKKAMLPMVLLANVIGFFILSQATSFGIIVVGAAFVGMGFGLLMPYGTMRVIEAAPKSSGTFANGLYMTFVNVGTAISPMLLAVIGAIFNKKNDGQFIWLVASILLVAGTVISIILTLTNKKVQTQK